MNTSQSSGCLVYLFTAANYLNICRHLFATISHQMPAHFLLIYNVVLFLSLISVPLQNRGHPHEQRTCRSYSFCSSLLFFNVICKAKKPSQRTILCFAEMLLMTANRQAGKCYRKVKGRGDEKPCRKKSPLTTAGPLSFHCVPHQMPIQGASGCWEAGERHPPTQSGGLCCVAHRKKREGQREAERCEKRCEERNYEFSA